MDFNIQKFLDWHTKTRNLPYRYLIDWDIKPIGFGDLSEVTVQLYKIHLKEKTLINTFKVKGHKEKAVQNAYYTLLQFMVFTDGLK